MRRKLVGCQISSLTMGRRQFMWMQTENLNLKVSAKKSFHLQYFHSAHLTNIIIWNGSFFKCRHCRVNMTMLNSLLVSKDDEVHQPLELEAVEGGSENNRAGWKDEDCHSMIYTSAINMTLNNCRSGGRMGIWILSENSSEEVWQFAPDNSQGLSQTKPP